MHERRVDRICAPGYLDGLDEKTDEQLHAMKAEAAEVETETSYVRRLAQARIDIVRAEQAKRAEGRRSIADLVEDLPRILAAQMRADASPAQVRMSPILAPDPGIDWGRGNERRIVDDSLARLPELSDADLAQLLADLDELERDVSARRRTLHHVIDTIDAEIARRVTAANP